MQFTPEMHSFQAEIGGNQCLVTRRQEKHGAIVTDSAQAGGNPRAFWCAQSVCSPELRWATKGSGLAGDSPDQGFLWQRHGS
jgi:hypothetical protein